MSAPFFSHDRDDGAGGQVEGDVPQHETAYTPLLLAHLLQGQHAMASSLITGLLLGASSFGGVLAGITVDRLLVQHSAFRRLGAEAWVDYSKQADLRAGLILYPLVAITHALLTLGGAIAISRSSGLSAAFVPAYSAAALALLGLALTARAAPVMLSLGKAASDAAAHQRAFDKFFFWSLLRGIAQVLAFAANLWSILPLMVSGT